MWSSYNSLDRHNMIHRWYMYNVMCSYSALDDLQCSDWFLCRLQGGVYIQQVHVCVYACESHVYMYYVGGRGVCRTYVIKVSVNLFKITIIGTIEVGQLKVHFLIHSLIPPFFSKKVEIFTSAEAFRCIMFVCKIFLGIEINLFGETIVRIVYLVCQHRNYHK